MPLVLLVQERVNNYPLFSLSTSFTILHPYHIPFRSPLFQLKDLNLFNLSLYRSCSKPLIILAALLHTSLASLSISGGWPATAAALCLAGIYSTTNLCLLICSLLTEQSEQSLFLQMPANCPVPEIQPGAPHGVVGRSRDHDGGGKWRRPH